MSHRLLPFAAARAAAASTALTPIAPVVPAAPAPAAQGGDDAVIDVVSLTEANAAVAAAKVEGVTAERERTAAVFSSDAGKANFQMAAFMLNANPAASADAIIAHLATMPAAAALTTPAPAAVVAPAAPAALVTNDLNLTPKIEVGADANEAGAEGVSAADQVKFWDTTMTGVAASASPFGGELAPGIRRTGN